MTRLRRNNWWRLFARRMGAGVALLCYLATAVGFPLPRPAQKDHRQPFPCQDHPCGCQTAEQCWRHCCCFSPEERFAWAEARQIEPPAYAEQPKAQGWYTARLRDRTEAATKGNPCDRCRARETCQACSAPARKSCCSKSAETLPKRPARSRWVTGLAGLRCQGGTSFWVSVGAVLPPPAPPAWSASFLPIGWLSHRNASPLPLLLTPPDPPPRLRCA